VKEFKVDDVGEIVRRQDEEAANERALRGLAKKMSTEEIINAIADEFAPGKREREVWEKGVENERI